MTSAWLQQITARNVPVDHESMHLLRDRFYAGIWRITFTTHLLLITVVIMLWNQSNRTGLVAWTLAVAIAMPMYGLHTRRDIGLERWFRSLGIHEFMVGSLWGTASLVAMPTTPEWQAIWGAVMVAVILSAAFQLAQFPRAYIGFILGCCLFTMVGYATFGIGAARIYVWFSVLAAIHAMLLADVERRVHLELVQAVNRNERIVKGLAQANDEVLKTNALLGQAIASADRLARTDALTGLANRLEFTDEVSRRLSDLELGESPRVSLAFIDLDKFKSVNDRHGHRAGDLLLIAVARRLAALATTRETVARLGGDEFVIVSVEDPENLEKRLRVLSHMRFIIEDNAISSSASIGVAWTQGDAAIEDLLRQADQAQYVSKRSGGATCVVVDADGSRTHGTPEVH